MVYEKTQEGFQKQFPFQAKSKCIPQGDQKSKTCVDIKVDLHQLLRRKMLFQNFYQNDMFKNIGKISGMVWVSIAEHQLLSKLSRNEHFIYQKPFCLNIIINWGRGSIIHSEINQMKKSGSPFLTHCELLIIRRFCYLLSKNRMDLGVKRRLLF